MLKPGEIPQPPPLSSDDRVKGFSAINSFSSKIHHLPSTDSAAQARVDRVATRILLAAGYDPTNIPVRLLQSRDEANAMAIGGKAIVVFDALLNKVKDDTELATVLSHEIGHLLGGHSKETSDSEREQNLKIGSTTLGVLDKCGTLNCRSWRGRKGCWQNCKRCCNNKLGMEHTSGPTTIALRSTKQTKLELS